MSKIQVSIKKVSFYDRKIGAIVKDTTYLVMPNAKFSQDCKTVSCKKDLIYEISYEEL